MKRVLINYLMFQAAWFACVLGAARGDPWFGPVVVLAAVAVHLAMAVRPGEEVRLLLSCAVFGLVFDSLLMLPGWVSFPNGQWSPLLAPYWMVSLWVVFATTLNLSMGWLKGRVWLAGAIGAVGGPLSYLAGQGLGGMEILQAVPALTALAIGWGLAMPLLSTLANRLDGFAPLPQPAYILTGGNETDDSGHV